MDRIIHCQVKLNCSPDRAFSMFIEDSELVTWLAKSARIEARVGGRYELFWDLQQKEINSTLGCTITALEPNKLLCFEWKGPVHLSFMNTVQPLTHVSVFFVPIGANDATEVHLVHTGWRDDEKWEAARLWFATVWTKAFADLKDRV